MLNKVVSFVRRYLITPFGRTLGIKSTRTKRATPNAVLEAAYNDCSRIHHKAVSNQIMESLALTLRCVLALNCIRVCFCWVIRAPENVFHWMDEVHVVLIQ